MIRFLDLVFCTFAFVVLSLVFVFVFLLAFIDTKSPIYIQERVGRKKQTYLMFKFRTMPINTKSAPTHEIDPNLVTKIGRFLRRYKLDELPQLWNVLRGDMSLVGPRPCLPSQVSLINAREKLGVFNSRPGVTGLAQINGIDMSQPELLAKTDAKMLSSFSTIQYFRYIFMTLLGNGSGDQLNRK